MCASNLNEYKQLFITESKERFQTLNDCLLNLEKNPNDKELITSLMREAHTLKSMAAYMGYVKMAYFSHVIEDVFDYARNRMIYIDKIPGLIDLLFKCIDTLGKSLDKIKKEDKELDIYDLTDELKKITGLATQDFSTSPRKEKDKLVIVKKQKKQTGKQKEGEDTEELQKKREEISNIDFYSLEKVENIKVKVETLDRLVDLVEELLISKMRLQRIYKEKNFSDFKKTLDFLDSLIGSLQYQIIQSRLVPIDFIFRRFPRMIRDLAKKQKKEIELEISGGNIDLDRTVIDKIGDPLVHILRNAIDHGIEKKGTITLSAKREKDHALIEIEDNGKGIDYEQVLKVACKKNIISNQEAKKMEEKQIFDLLFDPQFSTSSKVTDVSGRGVGLNVVKNKVESLGGSVQIKSRKGKGTKIILELPLTLAIIQAILIKVGGLVYAIPLSDIERVLKIKESDIKTIEGQETFILNPEEDLYLIRASQILSQNKIEQKEFVEDTKEKKEDLLVVVCKKGEDKIGMVVDSIIAKQDIIVKPLSKIFKTNKVFTGTTILEDGSVALILNALRVVS